LRVYDISSMISEGMAVWENKVEKQPTLSTETKGYVTETRIDLNVHTGTHIDSPLHMIPGGKTFETISIEKLVGPCKVLDLNKVEERITKADLEPFEINKNDFLLFKTKNSDDEGFNFNFVFLTADGAKYLAEKGIRGVGTDALGIERSQEGHPTHKTLFNDDIIIIEGLRLKDVDPGEYLMVAAPLKVTGIDAAPARVLLLEGVNY